MRGSPSSRSAWLLLLFLTLLNIINFVDRQLIVYLAPLLRRDLGLSLAKIALLYGYVFLVFYTLMGMALGNAADRFHRPRLIAGGLTLWSLLTAASGAALKFWHLLLARLLVGVGEATLTPASISMLSDVFPPKKRAFAAGFYYAGVPLGSGAGMLVAGWLAPRYGWRTCFYALGMLGLIFLPLLLTLKNPARGAAESSEVEENTEGGIKPAPAGQLSSGQIYRELFRSVARTPALPLAILAGVLLNFSISAATMVITWLNLERGFDYQRAAYTSGLIALVAGTLGTVLGGFASDWFQRRSGGGRMWFLVCKGLFFLPFTLGFYTLSVDAPGRLFYVCWFMSNLGSLTWYGPVFAAVQELAPVHIRSTAVAFLLLALNLLGSGLGPFVAGVIGDYVSLWRGLIICACVGFTAIIPAAIAARRYQTDLTRARAAESRLMSGEFR